MEPHDERRTQASDTARCDAPDGAWTRRQMIVRTAAVGAGSAVFGRAVAALAAAGGPVTAAMIREAEWVSGLDFPEDQRALMVDGINTLVADFEKVRTVPLDNAVPPAWRFATTAADDEAAAAFDELTRSGRDALMKRQTANAWPNLFRRAQLIPAVEYIRANRIRTLLMQAMDQATAGIDVYVCPSYGGGNLLLTNLTGHPAVVLPNGFRASDGTPTSITFTGRLFGEAELLAVANAYQQATTYHMQHPQLETSLKDRPSQPKG